MRANVLNKGRGSFSASQPAFFAGELDFFVMAEYHKVPIINIP